MCVYHDIGKLMCYAHIRVITSHSFHYSSAVSDYKPSFSIIASKAVKIFCLVAMGKCKSRVRLYDIEMTLHLKSSTSTEVMGKYLLYSVTQLQLTISLPSCGCTAESCWEVCISFHVP